MNNNINGEIVGFISGCILVLVLLLFALWRSVYDSMVVNECDSSIMSTVPAELKAPADGTTAKTE